MKKNKIMRFASAIMVMTLLSTCMVGGTFAKYTTSATSEDSARVAYWGFGEDTSFSIKDLFVNAYDESVSSTVDVIAPGTSKSQAIEFTYKSNDVASAPEVDYKFEVAATGVCDVDIVSNPNIKWAFYKSDTAAENIDWGTWDEMLTSINGLSQERVEAGALPSIANNSYTIAWAWAYETVDGQGAADAAQDATDTAMGNKAALDGVSVKITITATQVD